MKKSFLIIPAIFSLNFSAFSATSINISNSNNKSPLSASVDFIALPNSQHDSALNNEIFTEIVISALNRKKIIVNENGQKKYHLNFDISYVYYRGNAEYRFMSVNFSVQNKEKHAVCYINQSVWWAGPSGAEYVKNNAESSTDLFIEKCL